MFKKLIAGSIAAIAAIAAVSIWKCTRWWRTWGVRPVDSTIALPGDDLIEGPQVTDTRGITIAAPPEAVWPWLVQMGYGRAGWYSYDKLDMKGASADRILPAHQSLSVGDMVPTDPSGGFEVKVLDAGKAIVLYVDTAMVAERTKAGGAAPAEATPVGLAASGKFLQTATPPEFKASWAFVLRPERDGSTRLLERTRFWVAETKGAPKALAPLLGFGVFVMLQRQMLGLRTRAEGETMAPAPDSELAPDPVPQPV